MEIATVNVARRSNSRTLYNGTVASSQRTSAIYCLHVLGRSHRCVRDKVQ